MGRSTIVGKTGESADVTGGFMNVQSFFQKGVAVVPSDSTILTTTKGLYIGGAGNVVVTMTDDVDVTLTAISIGVIHPLSVKKVKATGTTATNIVAMY